MLVGGVCVFCGWLRLGLVGRGWPRRGVKYVRQAGVLAFIRSRDHTYIICEYMCVCLCVYLRGVVLGGGLDDGHGVGLERREEGHVLLFLCFVKWFVSTACDGGVNRW